MWGARRNVNDLALAHDHLFAIDEKTQRSLQDVGHLLAGMRMEWHERAAFQIRLRQHLAITADDLSRDHLRDLLECNLIPTMQRCCHARRLSGQCQMLKARCPRRWLPF